MIEIDLGIIEYYDESQNGFIYENGGVVRFEYSLKSVYDWESKWRKPFLKGKLSEEELMDYYVTMALDPVDPKFITSEVQQILTDYISDPNTATTFSSHQKEESGKGKVYSAEEIYALMFMENISIEFENRNLNRLLTMLRIIGNYKSPPKKMSSQDIYRQNAELNRMRREQMKTKG